MGLRHPVSRVNVCIHAWNHIHTQAYSMKALHDRLAREGVVWCGVDVFVFIFTVVW